MTTTFTALPVSRLKSRCGERARAVAKECPDYADLITANVTTTGRSSVSVQGGGLPVSVIQQISDDEMTVQINVNGRFDHRLSQQFRNAYRQIPDHDGITFHVDLSNASYIDSSALGMMLLLREYAKCKGGAVVIDSPSAQIHKILRVANFEVLFAIN